MKVKEIIEKLKEFDPEFEVTISDGLHFHFYGGDCEIKEFDGKVDIGVSEIEQEI